MKKLSVIWLVAILAVSLHVNAQEATTPNLFFEITKVKKQNDDFLDTEQELVHPFVKQRIAEGTQLAHVLMRVNYPNKTDQEYDYIAIDVYDDFAHINLPREQMMATLFAAFPNAKPDQMIKRFRASGDNMGSSVFFLQDEAFPGPGGVNDDDAKFVVVNTMKVQEGNGRAYRQMESDIFKPMHQADAKKGNRHDWLMLQRIMPYGSDYDDSYLTLDVFTSWLQMGKAGISDVFAEVHPDKKPEEAWEKMGALRELKRSEVWEIVMAVNTPAEEVSYEIIDTGNGSKAQNGQEVAWSGVMHDMDGNELFNTDALGFPFHTVVGDNAYDLFFDKGLTQIGQGGSIKITVPVGAQDAQTLNMSGGKPVIITTTVKEISAPKQNGAGWLREHLDEHSLAEVKPLYVALTEDNNMQYHFREGDMNALGYELMGDGKHAAAHYVLELNQQHYPKSWNACDSLADCYRAMGKTAEAKVWYGKALAINPTFTAAKNKLADLE